MVIRKFWLVSDTHWPTRGMYDLRWYILSNSDVDYVFHMWDFDVYSTYKYFKDYFWDKLIAVYGNCDDWGIKNELSEEKIVEINWIKILIFHSHSIYPRGDEIGLLEKALVNKVNMVFYWHTHIQKIHYYKEDNWEFKILGGDNIRFYKESWKNKIWILRLAKDDLKDKIWFINPGSLLAGDSLILEIF